MTASMQAARTFAGRAVGAVQGRSARVQGTRLGGTPSLRRAVTRGLRATPSLSAATQRFLDDAGFAIPVIKGPMYPGSNPELVAAVSAAGGLGVVQPISLTHLYGHDFREGLQLIKRLTDKPFGVNFTILENAKYKRQMDEWMHIAADEGVKFFLASLGKPDSIVAFAREKCIKVYHDAHAPRGQTGNRSAATFAKELQDLGIDLPLIQAGAIADGADLRTALDLGYAGASVGTRFLATHEAQVTESYKAAIVAASSTDIVWTNKLAGTNSSVIKTDQIASGGFRVNAVVAWLLRNPYTKTLTRTLMLKKAMETYKKAALDESVEIWQAGKGVDRIGSIESCAQVLEGFKQGLS